MALAVWLVVVTFLLYRIYLIIYNLYFNPLKEVPGPWLMSITSIPKAWKIGIAGSLWSDLVALHDEYGSVVRIGPNEVSCSSSTAWNEILGRKPRSELQPQVDTKYTSVTQFDLKNSILSNVKEDHAKIRKMMLPAFSDRAMIRQEETIKDWSDRMLQSLRRRAHGPIDLNEVYCWTTFDLMGDLAYGVNFGCLDNDRTHDVIKFCSKAPPYLSFLYGINHFAAGRQLQKLAAMLPGIGDFIRVHHFAKIQADERFDRKENADSDIMSLVWTGDGDAKVSRGQADQISSMLVIAGTETAATAVAGTTWWLLKTPHAYEALVKELRAEKEEDLTLAKLTSLPYLNACISEGLRHYSVVPVSIPRVVPAGGMFLDGFFLPEGSVCGASHYATYHTKHNWSEPEKFLPERWLPGDNPRFSKDQKKSFLPFGIGPRDCMGRRFALTELRIILGKLFFHFDIKLRPESSEKWVADEKTPVFFLRPKAAVMVDLKPAGSM